MMRNLTLAAAVLLLVATVYPGQAQTTAPAKGDPVVTNPDKDKTDKKKKKQPVDIEADAMEIHDKEKQAIFTGNVHAKRPDVTLDCDKLVVDYGDVKQTDGTTKTDVTHLDATGHVVIVTDKQKITGEHAVIDPKANTLVVTGNVVVTQGETVLHGPELHANLDTNEMTMSGGRVGGSFLPK